MIIRVSFVVVASIAALKASQKKTRPPAKKNSEIKSTGSDGSNLQYEFRERENRTTNAIHLSEEEESKATMPRNQRKGDFQKFEVLISGDGPNNVTEMELLRNLVSKYKQSQGILERKLIELKGLKEEQSAIVQLQRQLGDKSVKLELLNRTIASLQAESKILREKIREGVLAEKQLDITKKRINEMQKKNDVKAGPVKEQIMMLQQQLTEFQKYDDSCRNGVVNKKLKLVKDFDLQVLELKRKNKELELEKREVGMKLTTAQERIITEEKMVAKIRKEIACLRHVNEELTEQVERLQENKFDMVQELVYQRWLYICLRFEAQNHQKQSRKTSIHDCSQNSSKELYIKANLSPSDPELDSVSSNATLLESDENDTTTLESSSSSQSSSSKNSSLLRSLKRWGKNIDDSKSKAISSKGSRSYNRNSPSSHNLIRRFSADSGDDDSVQDSSRSLETPIYPRTKRVSFSDSLKQLPYYHMSETDEDVIKDDKATKSGQSVEESSNIRSCKKLEAEKYEKLCNSNEYAGDIIAENNGNQNKIGHSEELEEVFAKDDKVKLKTQVVQLLASFFFFFFLFFLLVCFRIK